MSLLSTGASGAQVAELQRRLNGLGVSPGAIDGQFGPATAQALRLFQDQHGLPATGVYDPQTEAAFGARGVPAGASIPGRSPMNPEEDPTYLAYMRNMVPDEGELKATIAMKQNMLRNELVNRTTASQTSLQNQLANTGRDWASRGAAFFGGRQKQEAEQARQSTADQNLVQSQYAGQQMDLQDKLTTGLAQIRRGQTEAGLTARQQLPIQNAQQGVY